MATRSGQVTEPLSPTSCSVERLVNLNWGTNGMYIIYIYIYIYTYIHMCIIYMCIYVYIYICVFTQLMRNAPSPFPLFITVCSCRWCQPTNTSALKQKWCFACKQRFHPACGIIVPMRLTITKSDDHDRARFVFNTQIKHHIFVILTVLNNSISWLKLTQKTVSWVWENPWKLVRSSRWHQRASHHVPPQGPATGKEVVRRAASEEIADPSHLWDKLGH